MIGVGDRRRTVGMTISEPLSLPATSIAPVYERFLAAVVNRDFVGLGATLRDDVRLRALVPPGPFALAGPPAVVAQFEQWFGGGRSFEVLSHSADVVGTRVHARWTVRRTPDAPDASPLTAEQHAFLTADDRVRSIDLLCSGWQDAR